MDAREIAQAIGRKPHLDDVCAECEFELPDNPTSTFAYVTVRRNQLETVHWCSRHQAEVSPLSAGRVTQARSGGNFPTSAELAMLHGVG